MFNRNAYCRNLRFLSLKAVLFFALSCTIAFAVACKSGDQTTTSNSNANANKASTSTASTSIGTTALSSGGDFEGAITMKVEGQGEGGEMTFYTKGQQTRMEMHGGGQQMAAIMDMSSGKMTMLLPQQKMYMTMDFKGMAEGRKKDAQEEYLPDITPTGQTETVAGYTCEHYKMSKDGRDMDMCMAKGLGYFGMGQPGRENIFFSPKMMEKAKAHPEWSKLLEGGAFPLKMTVTKNGQVESTMEATKIERKPLDDSLFTVPPDYREFKAPQMPGGMPNAPKMPTMPNQ